MVRLFRGCVDVTRAPNTLGGYNVQLSTFLTLVQVRNGGNETFEET